MKKRGRHIGYARASTRSQRLNLQRNALKEAGCELIFSDKGVSGACKSRKGLNKALAELRPHDKLYVWKLDRLGRSLKFLVDLIEQLNARSCGFVSLTDGIDTTTSTGELVYKILAVIAEFERGLISERTRAGLEAARRRGAKIGRPRKLTAAQTRRAYQRVKRGVPISRAARRLRVSHDTLARAFERLNLRASAR
jgi:DNA invertase Pin-like site-specific DNA recombinase